MDQEYSTQTTTAEREAATAGHEEQGIAGLLKAIRDETTTLFRQEVALARAEVSEKTSRVIRNIMLLGAGALVAFAGAIVLLIAAGEGLAAALVAVGMEANAFWLGPLIVGAIVVIVGIALLMKGKNTLQNESLALEQTAASMKENKEWVKNRAK